MSGLDDTIAALAQQMSASLLSMSQDGATQALLPQAEALAELVSDLSLAVEDPATPPTFAGWAGAVSDSPPSGLL